MPQGKEEWLKAVTCLRCGDWCEPTGRSFRFGVFDGRTYLCEGCSKKFNAFYRDDSLSHTVPRGGVEVKEKSVEEAEPTETPLALQELEPMNAEENPEEEASKDQIDSLEPELEPIVQAEETEVQGASDAPIEHAAPLPITVMETEVEPAYIQNEIVDFMRELREDVERIKDLSRDEEEVVGEFSRAFLDATAPLSLALPVDASLLPVEMEDIERASVSPRGVLVLLMRNGTMETMNLSEQENRDLLVTVVRDALPHYKTLLQLRRQKIEQRIALLSKATTDLREIADYIASKNL